MISISWVFLTCNFIGFSITYLSAAGLDLQVLKPLLSSPSPTSSHGKGELGRGSPAQVTEAECVGKWGLREIINCYLNNRLVYNHLL